MHAASNEKWGRWPPPAPPVLLLSAGAGKSYIGGRDVRASTAHPTSGRRRLDRCIWRIVDWIEFHRDETRSCTHLDFACTAWRHVAQHNERSIVNGWCVSIKRCGACLTASWCVIELLYHIADKHRSCRRKRPELNGWRGIHTRVRRTKRPRSSAASVVVL